MGSSASQRKLAFRDSSRHPSNRHINGKNPVKQRDNNHPTAVSQINVVSENAINNTITLDNTVDATIGRQNLKTSVQKTGSKRDMDDQDRKVDVVDQNESHEERHKRTFKAYKSEINQLLSSLEKDEQNKTILMSVIEKTNEIYISADANFSHTWMTKHRTAVCDYIHCHGQIIPVICEAMISEKDSNDMSCILYAGSLTMVCLSDHSRDCTVDICAVPGFNEFLYEFIDKNKENSPYVTSLGRDSVITRILMVIHNVSMTHVNIPLLQQLNIVKVLKNYLSFNNDTIKLVSLLAIADLMKDDEAHYIATNISVITSLLKLFEQTINSEGHREADGKGVIWSSLELVKGIGRLARNDDNKKLLVDQGCLPSLIKLAKSTDLEEKKESLKALWVLSFNENNQDRIIDEPGLIQYIDDENRTGETEVKATCSGILWTLRLKLLQSKEYEAIGERLSTIDKAENDDEEKGHVMISYQWANQDVLIKVRDELRRHGYKVWMDIDDMEGSTLQAMAEAIEQAEVVLICMSRKYKDSPNCRAEGEYAHQRRKKIIPLILERGYQPDGWLGLILGAKLFYDFSGKYSFQSRVGGLLKDIKIKVNSQLDSTTTASTATNVLDKHNKALVQVHQDVVYSTRRSLSSNTVIRSWTNDQIKQWLSTHKLSGSRIEELTGIELAFLRKLQHMAPDLYFRKLENDLNLKSLTDLAKFDAAMDELP
ncbi:uncharacterized protein LOC126810559 [Patella vulgata]|uniref:uncharacterized protein LOC126810559 n=1 Tax=Patella vulgata TaxID=6465 RepID=UPI0021800804|nr:uncharacterized protein LOC126810559 [Patella vulgata]